MKIIPLTQGKSSIVDDEDYEFLMQWKWHYGCKGYACRTLHKSKNNKEQKTILMHRLILKTPKNMETDHINTNKLDNRKSNLRICTQRQNCNNRNSYKGSASKYKGVVWNKKAGKWQPQIVYQKQHFYLGIFDNQEFAAIAYNNAATVYFKEFARLNLISNG